MNFYGLLLSNARVVNYVADFKRLL